MMRAIVDIQGFRADTKNFIPKEIAVQCPDQVLSILIKPPYAHEDLSTQEKMRVEWVGINKGVLWHEGYVNYDKYRNCIEFLKRRIVFVKGADKAAWLRKVLEDDDGEETIDDSGEDRNPNQRWRRPPAAPSNIHNLEHFDCPPLSKLHKKYRMHEFVPCDYHKGRCAHRNVQYMMKWVADNKIFG